MATLSPANFTAAAAVVPGRRTTTTTSKVNHINGLNSFGGLKAHNSVALMGSPVCTQQSFANFVCSLKKPLSSSNNGGGALSSTCNAVGEIFKIAAIMNGLTLVGVAVGFLLLRIEAYAEESE